MPTYPPTSTPLSSSNPVVTSIVPPITTPSHPTASKIGSWALLSRSLIISPKTSSDHHVASEAGKSLMALDGLNLLRDTATWPAWNSFCPRAEFLPPTATGTLVPTDQANAEGEGARKENWLYPGSSVRLDVHLNGTGLVVGAKRSRTTDVVVTRIEQFNKDLTEGAAGNGGVDGDGGDGDGVGSAKKGWRICWKALGTPAWSLWSERVLEFIEVKEGLEFRNWETFGGILAPLVKLTVGSQLQDRFGDYARDIKTYLENQQQQQQPHN